MRLISILLIFTLLGCDDNGGNRRRRRPIDDTIATPTPIEKAMPLTEAQRTQVSARASMFKELAANARNGSAKTIWDVNKFCVEYDKISRSNYDSAFSRAMANSLRTNDDNLPANAAEIFEGMAKQFEAVLK